jgi:plasmid stabilization system protein ParE
MPPATIIFHPLASREFRSARAWYRRRNPRAAQRFSMEVFRVSQAIVTAPDRGAILHGPYRWMRLRKFPYLLYYATLDPQRVMVYAVAHAHRRPGYWLRRTRP